MLLADITMLFLKSCPNYFTSFRWMLCTSIKCVRTDLGIWLFTVYGFLVYIYRPLSKSMLLCVY